MGNSTDEEVEALAKHLYLTTDTLWDHRVVTWDRLDEHYGDNREDYRQRARRYLRVAYAARS